MVLKFGAVFSYFIAAPLQTLVAAYKVHHAADEGTMKTKTCLQRPSTVCPTVERLAIVSRVSMCGCVCVCVLVCVLQEFWYV